MAKTTSGARGPTLSTFQSLAIASQFGATLGGAVALGLFAGQWLDVQLGSSPALTLIGVFLGFAAAITSTVTLYRTLLRRNEAEWRQKNAQAAPNAADDPDTYQTRGPA